MTTETLKKQAREHEQNEAWEKALSVYRRAIEQAEEGGEPEIGLYNRVADLELRLGNVEAALSQYERAIELYMEADLPNNAIAICRKIQRNVPGRPETFLRMGEIRGHQGFQVEARQHILTYAEMMESAGDSGAATAALEGLVELFPGDAETRIFLGERLVGLGEGEAGVAHLLGAWQELSREGAQDPQAESEARALEARILELDPEATFPLPSAESGREGPGRGGLPGLESSAGFILDDPQDGAGEGPGEVTADFAEIGGLGDGGAGFSAADLPEADAALGDDDLSNLLGDPQGGVERFLHPEAPAVEDPPETEGGGDLEVEAIPGLEGFEGTGLVDEVEEGAEVGEEAESGSLPEASGADEDGPRFEAVDGEGAGSLLEQEDEDESGPFLDPVAEGGEHPSLEPVSHEGEEASDADAWDDAQATELPGFDPLPTFEPPAEDPAAAQVEGMEVAGAEAAGIEAGEGGEEAADVEDDPGIPQTVGALEAALAAEPTRLELHRALVDRAHELEDRRLLLRALAGLATAQEGAGEPDRAQATWDQLLQLDPRHQGALEGKARLERVGGGPAVPAPSEEESGFVDLGALVLDDEEAPTTRWVVQDERSGDEDADFAQMLSKFKAKVAQHITRDDARSSYDLGTAYREMGLMEEAIGMFQQALRAHPGHLASLEMLGQCFLDREEPQVAIRVLERALEGGTPVEDDLLGIYYFLGVAHDRAGNRDEAREFYEKVFSLDINFKDVTERLRQLR